MLLSPGIPILFAFFRQPFPRSSSTASSTSTFQPRLSKRLRRVSFLAIHGWTAFMLITERPYTPTGYLLLTKCCSSRNRERHAHNMANHGRQIGQCRSLPCPRSFSLFAYSHVLIVLLFFVQFSWQQEDPISDFCRRFGHQSAVIDDKLYLDGGLVDWNPISQNPANYSSKNPS